MTNLKAVLVTFAYKNGDPVFSDLSLELRPGEVTVLLGANAAGKTTLLRTLAGQLTPTSGQVVLDGQPLKRWSRRAIAQRLTLMPQTELCTASMTVRDSVRLGRVAHRGWWLPMTQSDEEIVESALVATELRELANRPITELSGGQWRRTVLARSLAQETKVLLLDEPTSGLDLKHQYECLQRVRDLVHERNLVALISLHDLQQAAMFADRIALLGNGELLACGDCSSVFTESLIEQAYGVRVSITPHPVHRRPLVVPMEGWS